MSGRPFDRRRFLVGLGAVGGASLLGPLPGCARRAVEALGRLTEPLADSAEAEALGVEYMSRHPAESRRVELENVLLDSLPAWRMVNDVTDALHQRMLADFDRQDTVRLGGWLFSRTELRLYALVAMRQQAHLTPYRTGVFPIETEDRDRFRWTGSRASVQLTPGDADFRLRLRATAPFEQSVTIDVDGARLGRAALVRGEWQTLRYLLPEAAGQLQLVVTPSWQPRNDFRTLGVQWNERSSARPS